MIVVKVMKKHSDKLMNKDESIFDNNLRMLPGIDFTALWPTLTSNRKNKIWTYLNILFINAELLLENDKVRNEESEVRNIVNQMVDDINIQNTQEEQIFNPFEGIDRMWEQYAK